MRLVWILITAMAIAVGIVLLPGSASAGVDCWAKGGCGEVRDGLPSHLSSNPVNWKCVKAAYRPMYPGLPVCAEKRIEMKKAVPNRMTFGESKTPGVVQTK